MNNCAFGLSSRSAAWCNITWFKSTFDSCVFFTLHTVVVKLIMPAICCIKCGFFFFFFFFYFWRLRPGSLLVLAVCRIWSFGTGCISDLAFVAHCW